MPKTPAPESLAVEDLGDLSRYQDAELLRLREKLITNERRIQDESTHLAKRIKELNAQRSSLQHDLAENARSMRAVKHQLSLRTRDTSFASTTSRARARRHDEPRLATRTRSA